MVGQTARVPWDDRRAFDARIEDLREAAVREFPRDVGSGLVDEPAAGEVYRRMRLTVRANGFELPRNVALLLFADEPERWFPGARIVHEVETTTIERQKLRCRRCDNCRRAAFGSGRSDNEGLQYCCNVRSVVDVKHRLVATTRYRR